MPKSNCHRGAWMSVTLRHYLRCDGKGSSHPGRRKGHKMRFNGNETLNEPIESIQQAKIYFMDMGCSHFHMAREYPQRYEEYTKMNISKEQETEWGMEQFNEYYTDIMEDKCDTSLWIVHSRMYDLINNSKTDFVLDKVLEATEHIRDKVPFKERIIVSETINGRGERQVRTGLIYLSYDLNYIAVAKNFMELSFHFSSYYEGKSMDFQRCQEALRICNCIKAELNL